MAEQPQAIKPIIEIEDFSSKRRFRDLPWWFFAIILIAVYAFIVISQMKNIIVHLISSNLV